MLSIYCLENSEWMDFDSDKRGYRGDIYVKADSEYFQLNIYDIVRLKQDFETEIEYYGFFDIESNIVLVEDVTLVKIKKTIEYLYSKQYFKKIKPLEIGYIDKLDLFEV
jgi:hypothetical protein